MVANEKIRGINMSNENIEKLQNSVVMLELPKEGKVKKSDVKKAIGDLTNDQINRLQEAIQDVLDARAEEEKGVTEALENLKAQGISKAKLQSILAKM